MVRVTLVDKGNAINAFGLDLKGEATQEIELNEDIKNLKRQNLITYEEVEKPAKKPKPDQA